MKRAISALLCAAALVVTVSTAEARPHHRHHHRHQRHHVAAVQQEEQGFFSSFSNGFQHGMSAGTGFVERARQFVGETAHQVGVRSTLWCSAFLRKVTGASGVDDRALSWENHRRIAPQVGAIVTMGRRGGGHVGIVSGFKPNGDPIVISGNHGGRVREAVYSRHRIRTWVSPT